MEAGLLCF